MSATLLRAAAATATAATTGCARVPLEIDPRSRNFEYIAALDKPRCYRNVPRMQFLLSPSSQSLRAPFPLGALSRLMEGKSWKKSSTRETKTTGKFRVSHE